MAPMKCPARRERYGDANYDDYVESWTLTHVARHWNVSRRTVRELLGRGQLPFEEINGQLRVPTEAVRDFEIQAHQALGNTTKSTQAPAGEPTP